MDTSTVRARPVDGHPMAFWLEWDAEVNPDHVPLAFDTLTAALDRADRPIHVLVDLRSDPAIPLSITVEETLAGPLNHDRMGEWLVIGTNWRAKMLAQAFNKVSPRANIHWFDTEDEAFARLAELESASAM